MLSTSWRRLVGHQALRSVSLGSTSGSGLQRRDGWSSKRRRLATGSLVAATAATGGYLLSQPDNQDKMALWLLHSAAGRSLLISADAEENVAKYNLRRIMRLKAAQSLARLAGHAEHARDIVGDALLVDALLLSSGVFSSVPDALAADAALAERHRNTGRELLPLFVSFWQGLLASRALGPDRLVALGLYRSLSALLRAGSDDAVQLQRIGDILAQVLAADHPLNHQAAVPLDTDVERLREMLDSLGFAPLQRILACTGLDDAFRVRVTSLCPRLCKTASGASFLADSDGGLSFLLALPSCSSTGDTVDNDDLSQQLWSNTIKTLANMAHACPEIASQLLQTTSVESVLRANLDLSETARCLANLSRAERNKPLLVAHGWPEIVSRNWLSAHAAPQVKLAALICINDLARQPPLVAGILDQVSIRRLVDVCEQHADDRLLASAMVRIVGQIFVSLARSSPDCVQRLFRVLDGHDENALLRLKSLVDRHAQQRQQRAGGGEYLSAARDVDPYQFISRTLGCIADTPDARIAEALLSPDGDWWRLISDLADNDSVDVQRETAHTIANIVSRVDNRQLLKTMRADLLPLLDRWTHSADLSLAVDAIRAQASLYQPSLQASKYVDGVYLLHPTSPDQEDSLLFDVVFIHGVTGHFLGTWKVGDPAEEEQASMPLQGGNSDQSPSTTSAQTDPQQSRIWAKDWLPQDFPHARVLSVSYEVQISGWFGSSLPMKEQAKRLLKNLRLGALGARPVVFVCHSFGGLLVKEMLMYASTHADYRGIVDNTLGIAFYATPHRGAELSRLSENPVLDKLVRSTDVVYDLHPENRQLSLIHQHFCDALADSISTLSFGESRETCIAGVGSRKFCMQIVPEESADPKFSGPNHTFLALPHNHRTICKPVTREDPRYANTVQWIRALVAPLVEKQRQKEQARLLGSGYDIDEIID